MKSKKKNPNSDAIKFFWLGETANKQFFTLGLISKLGRIAGG